MPLSDETTLRALNAPTVLAIGCPPELTARCAQALEGIGAVLAGADVVTAPTLAAARQPLAIVLMEDLYAFDPDEFDALARDVRASLVKVEEDISAAMLELLLSAAIDAALDRRRDARAAGQQAVVRPALGDRAAPPPPPASAQDRSTGRQRRPSFSDFEAPRSSR
jgi:hypothetical protein